MPVIGLTGNIATGKSTIAERLKELGAEVIDADVIARDLVRPGMPAWQIIVDVFGENYLLPDGSLDRKKLGDLVFTDPRALQNINEIIHPRVVSICTNKAEKFRSGPGKEGKVLVVQVPLLFEVGLDKVMDQIWLVTADPETQLKRLMDRSGLTEQQALDRIESQAPPEQKIPLVERVIDTRGSIRETYDQVDKYWRDLVGH